LGFGELFNYAYETKGRRNGAITMSQSAFVIYDRDTEATLATLPLTIPIGATVEGFTKAGLNVGWKWGNL